MSKNTTNGPESNGGTFENSGFLNLKGQELQTLLGYKSAHFCDRTPQSDNMAVNKDATVYISAEEYQKKIGSKDGHGIYWTDDINEELPIVMAGAGIGKNLQPETICQAFLRAVKLRGDNTALFQQKNNKVLTWTWNQYKADVFSFAKSLYKVGVQERKVVNIMGFNAPEWLIALNGTLFLNGIQSGVYTTNNAESCHYQADHSEAEALVCDTLQQFEQYVSILHKLPKVKALVGWGLLSLPEKYKNDPRLFTWSDFLKVGQDISDATIMSIINQQKPNQCASLIYTSGTTGRPKGVMLSHDNLMFNGSSMLFDQLMVAPADKQLKPWDFRALSYLPLSHIVALTFDVIAQLVTGGQIYFARPDALQGTLIESMKWCKPTYFFAVPRVWEKIEISLKEIIMQHSDIVKELYTWAEKPGIEKIKNLPKGIAPGQQYDLANQLVYRQVKQYIGLEHAKFFMYGAAPMKQSTVNFLAGFDIPVLNLYGMSETTGCATTALMCQYDIEKGGQACPGLGIRIGDPDSTGQGEVQMKGRHVMMGYLKNAEATKKVIASDGYLSSGDLGRFYDNWLCITGRIKEIIITSGGENIAPVAIEDLFRLQCAACSNIILLGEQQRFVAALITFKSEFDAKGRPTKNLLQEAKEYFKQVLSLDLATTDEVCSHAKVLGHIQDCVNQANAKIVSRAAHIRKFVLLSDDFTVPGGELTPTMKLRRSETVKKYKAIVDDIYKTQPKM